jgi:hypothetical protein
LPKLGYVLADHSKFKTEPAAPSQRAANPTLSLSAPEVVCIAKELAEFDGATVEAGLIVVLVGVTVGIIVDEATPTVLLRLELDVVLGLLTKNQSAATGAPNPVSSENCVRLKPTRLNTLAVKLLKKGTKSAGISNLAGSEYRKTPYVCV